MKIRTVLIGLALAVTTVAVYLPVRDFAYIQVDDPAYVFENPQVRAGLILMMDRTFDERQNSVIRSWSSIEDLEQALAGLGLLGEQSPNSVPRSHDESIP